MLELSWNLLKFTVLYHSQKDDFYECISGVEKWFDISNYKERRSKRSLPAEKTKKVIGVIKGKAGGKIILDFAAIALKQM